MYPTRGLVFAGEQNNSTISLLGDLRKKKRGKKVLHACLPVYPVRKIVKVKGNIFIMYISFQARQNKKNTR